MSRHIKLEEAFLFEGFAIDGKQVFPLSANRRTFLRRMGNSVCGGTPEGDPDDGEEFGAALYACTLKPDELGPYIGNPGMWSDDSLAFTIGLNDHVVERFQEVMKAEVEALQSSQVDPLGKAETP